MEYYQRRVRWPYVAQKCQRRSQSRSRCDLRPQQFHARALAPPVLSHSSLLRTSESLKDYQGRQLSLLAEPSGLRGQAACLQALYQQGSTCNVATRSVKACNKAESNRIANTYQNDRDRCRCLLRCKG